MPGFAEAAKTVREELSAGLWSRRPDLLIGFDNLEGLANSSGEIKQEAEAGGDPVPWVRIAIRHSEANQITLGAQRRWRQQGTVIVQIFVPKGSGDGEAYSISEYVAASIRGAAVNGVVFEATMPARYVGPTGAWFQVNTSTPFYYDEIT